MENARHTQGLCTATIQRKDGSSREVELAYEGEEHEDGGYNVFVERPDVTNVLDLLADVVDAIYDDGRIQDIHSVTWL